MVSIFHVVAMAKRARSGDDKMRCEFLLILYLICLWCPPPQRPKVLKRLRNEWQREERVRGEQKKEGILLTLVGKMEEDREEERKKTKALG